MLDVYDRRDYSFERERIGKVFKRGRGRGAASWKTLQPYLPSKAVGSLPI